MDLYLGPGLPPHPVTKVELLEYWGLDGKIFGTEDSCIVIKGATRVTGVFNVLSFWPFLTFLRLSETLEHIRGAQSHIKVIVLV